jgi:biopolymer transport protein ExbD
MKSQAAILPLVDLVFLALGAMLACMTQMELIHTLPVEVTRIGKGPAVPQHGKIEVLTLTAQGMTLNGEPITEHELVSSVTNKKIVLRVYKGLPTEATINVIAKLAEAGAEVSIEVKETNFSNDQ